MRKSMSSASRMASFINQQSTCSHLDPYALILRCGRDREGRTLVIVEEYGTGNPQKCWQSCYLRSYLLEPIKDRSSLATIFSVHELSHAKTSKSIHPTLPIRPAVAGFHPGRSWFWRDGLPLAWCIWWPRPWGLMGWWSDIWMTSLLRSWRATPRLGAKPMLWTDSTVIV